MYCIQWNKTTTKTQRIETKSQLQKISVIRKKFYDFSLISYALFFVFIFCDETKRKNYGEYILLFPLCCAAFGDFSDNGDAEAASKLHNCHTRTLTVSHSQCDLVFCCYVDAATCRPFVLPPTTDIAPAHRFSCVCIAFIFFFFRFCLQQQPFISVCVHEAQIDTRAESEREREKYK